MQRLKSILDFYINSSIHVALAVCAMLWITLIQFGLEFDRSIIIFTFFASITGYNFVKFFGIAKFHHRRLTNRLKWIQIFSFFCFVGMLLYFFRLQKNTMIYIGIFGVITFLYAVPIIPKRIFIDQHKNLRSISGLKIYIIALVWTGVTVLLPLIDKGTDLSSTVWLTCLQRFLIIIVLMLPFEIRDLNFDSLKLSTVPQKIGITGTKVIGISLLIIVLIIEIFTSRNYDNSLLLHGGFVAILALFLLLSFQRQTKYYTAFWVEAIPIFWLLGLLIF